MDKEFFELQKYYLQGLSEKLDEVEVLIIKLENGNEDQDTILRDMKRIIHSIKGSAGSYNINFLTTICHKFEDYLAQISCCTNYTNHINILLKYYDLMIEFINDFCPAQKLNSIQYQLKLESITPRAKAKHSVLVVEPTKSFRMLYAKLFNSMGIDVSFSTNGHEALARLLRERFGSLLTAKYTELINGPSLIAALRVIEGQNRYIPTVLITSDQEPTAQKIKNGFMVIKDKDFGKKIVHIYEDILQYASKKEKQEDKPVKEEFSTEDIPKKILYVDDDADIHALVKVCLKKIKGTSFKLCTSGSEALKIAPDFKPDLILLDVLMPEMKGPEVLKELKLLEETRDIPVGFLTAISQGEEIKRLKEIGAAGIILKPFNLRTLPEDILRVWRNRKKRGGGGSLNSRY
ncbi:MAG: response regulator [Thermodesulfobacteriota bacterium]|nr:response regulator [Thermodesulfobacteriota bacterium]